jgi:hypothetical protein
MYILHLGNEGQQVDALRTLLNTALDPSPHLPSGRKFDFKTRDAVLKFQKAHGLSVDGKVGAATWRALGEEVGTQDLPMMVLWGMPAWIRNLVTGKSLANGFNPSTFFGMYMEEWGGLSNNQIQGLNTLLAKISADPDVTDIRWAAYMLATVKHECDGTWQPIEEGDDSKSGRPYNNAKAVTDQDGKQYTNTYYGRGYVQLTWDYNYRDIGAALGMGEDLLIHPEKALDPDIAYKIMSYGMRKGSFTGKKLSDYIHDTICDYKNARRIINGLDQWALIKGYAEKLEAMLRASAPY